MYPILIFDEQMNYIAQIDDYEYFRWTRRWRKPHSWELQINRYKNNVQYLQTDYCIAVQRGGKWRAGRIAHKEISLNQEGKISEDWKIFGHDFSGVFYDRIALHLTSEGNGYDVQKAPAETTMKHYITTNCISPVDVSRTIPGLRLATDFSRGITIETRARFQNIAELLESISLASGLGYETLIDLDTKAFIFDVIEGRDLTPSQNENPPVTFSPEFDNVSILGYRYSKLDSKNYAIVAGQGEAEERQVVHVVDGEPEIGLNRREVFFDARDLETEDQLIQRGHERLAEYAEELVMEVEHLPNGPFKYMKDFDLGDIVHVRYPEIGSMEARIVEVVEEISPQSGDSFKLVIGKEWPDLISVLKSDRRNFEVETRR